MEQVRVHKPTTAQFKLLSDLQEHGAMTAPVRRYQLDHDHQIGTWIVVVERGWVSVDRKTPDNRGGDPHYYEYRIEPAGQAAMDVFTSPTRKGQAS